MATGSDVTTIPEPVEGRAPRQAVVELAPMAGVTNAAYRQLCREQHEAGGGTDGLFVCEMITSRGIVERDRKTMAMLQFDPGETTRSVQLYGVDPVTMADATQILCEDFAVRHVDLNFGCPVPKVTRKGGGAALPWKRDRLRAILRAVVGAAQPYGVPVTMKTRIGIDDEHVTYLDAGTIAEEEGCASIALHGRTAQQSYSGHADWSTIAKLKEHVSSIRVLGNGDVWEADDAVRMLDQTGADGVVVGRGCLGRPWLFHDLAVALGGGPDTGRRALPTSGEVAATIRRHAGLLAGLQDDPDHGERRALTDLRKHMAWYLKGYPVGGDTRRALAMVSSLEELDTALDALDPDLPFPVGELGTPRGRQGAPKAKVALPEHWLDDTSGAALDLDDDEHVSGG